MDEHLFDQTLSPEICDKVSQYYSLKNEYETSVKNNKKKVCVCCGGHGGNLFTVFKNEEGDRILSAVCKFHLPCKMNIEINVGSFSNVHDDLQENRIVNNKIKQSIITFKNDVLFGIIDDMSYIKLEHNDNVERLNDVTEMKLLYDNTFHNDNDEMDKSKRVIDCESKIIKLLNNTLNGRDDLLSNKTLKIIYDAYSSDLFSNKNIDFTSYTICNYFINIINGEILSEQFQNPTSLIIINIKKLLEDLLILFKTIDSYKYNDYNLLYDETVKEIGLTKHNIYNMQLNESSPPSIVHFEFTPTTNIDNDKKSSKQSQNSSVKNTGRNTSKIKSSNAKTMGRNTSKIKSSNAKNSTVKLK